MRQLLYFNFVALFALACGRSVAAEDSALSAKPNIIVIMTDEHNAGVMGCAGDSLARTPNLDSLAKKGVIFNAFYCQSPICIPSRQSFTTGKYVSHHNVWGNTVGVPEGTPSLPRILDAAGYECFLDGKMHYKGGMTHGFKVIDEKTGKIRTSHDQDTTPENAVKAVSSGPRHRIPPDLYGDNGAELGAEFSPMGATTNMDSSIDVFRRNTAMNFIRERGTNDKPFFLVVGFISPHYSLVVPPEYLAHFKDKVPMPEIPPGYIDQLPLNYKHLRNDRKMENVPPEVVKLARESYYALVEWTDHQIGQVLDTLKASQFASNTIVIYTSDHGEDMGEHGLWWKNCLYDCGARVPLIVSWPECWKGGQARHGVCSMVDLVQTIAAIAGAKVPTDWDGASFLPLLNNASAPWKDMAISQYYAAYICSGITMIRQGDWKYVYHARANETHGPERELYNMISDPKELHNLASDPKQQDRMQGMHSAMVKELGEDPEQSEKRWRAGATPEYPNGITNPKPDQKTESRPMKSAKDND